MTSAQIVMSVNQPIEIRLNDEVRAIMLAKPLVNTASLTKGMPIYWDQLGPIEAIELTTADANAAHITLVLARGGWLVSFDFRYNAAIIGDLLEGAHQFLEAAKSAEHRKHYRSCMENLFAAAELTARARLTLMPDSKILHGANHRHIHAGINSQARLGNVDRCFVDLLNDLARRRKGARYFDAPIEPEAVDMESMIATVESEVVLLSDQLPRHHKIGP